MTTDLNDYWALFEAKMVPEETPPQVRHEMKRLFFHGAAHMWGQLNQPSIMQMAVAHQEYGPEVEAFLKAEAEEPA